MIKALVFDKKGEKAGEIELPKEIFGLDFNADLVHQVVLSQASNRRQGTAKVKDRGEVRGGGKKPWRQKGTGRARHGSRRSPIWVGGGVAFGPTTEKDYKKIIPKKIRRKALLSVLSEKARNKFVLVWDGFEAEKPSTKKAANLINKIIKNDSGMLILPGMDKNTVLSFRNIKKISAVQAKDMNALDLLNKKYVVILKDSLEGIKKTFVK
ncbi:MAG: 50S ribosomal protein L4 [Candidatus Nealsonbacteria bacterium RIFOXYB1_FULL_40_15]|uniref:Large ribosomal subunit protein uL4 n=2 Tax=Candidatus Nealsoniibacteriota TaxID=1817911 RepID=A0A1G2ELL2_9BACT|nr:MAG: 50S ribosomal protein L4 [Candidatus Nealsonbacteria bacterium RIFOXYC1_FULL_40_7]OGZ27821.1 MAG: 50S ribosomal protein L4 [Candidatus Nealsonbacteria bacterium RIFOXYB1_FULL_40_15]OGZ28927.1 MAG: 50S ribosomal protein L4 [Candidatus Nealsonbacteria bacterium RIFOXYD1_FULL_39_11]